MENTRDVFKKQFFHPGEDLLTARDKTAIGRHETTSPTSKKFFTTRDELLAVLRQDVRNPIGVAMSCANMLLEDPEFKNLSGETKDWISVIKRNSEMSLRIINDVHDVERIDEGSLQLKVAPHTLNRILAQAVEAYARSCQKKIKLQAEDRSSAAEVDCDLGRMTQVLTNLLHNAEKYTTEGGQISISASLQKNDAFFTVTDTGLGIPAARMVHVFDRFYQLRNIDRSGPGLGLYLSKKLVEVHGGKMWADSVPGKGSVFSFTLPLRGRLMLN